MARVTPFYRSLNEARLTFGVDNRVFVLILLGTFGLLIAGAGWWAVALGAVALVVMKSLFRTDPHYLAIYACYSKEGDQYEPWPTASWRTGRKRGRGKGVLC